MLISLIGALIVGLVVGALARLIVPGRDPMGWFATAILGIVGAFVGSSIGVAIWGPNEAGQYGSPGLLLSIGGAVLALLVWRKIR